MIRSEGLDADNGLARELVDVDVPIGLVGHHRHALAHELVGDSLPLAVSKGMLPFESPAATFNRSVQPSTVFRQCASGSAKLGGSTSNATDPAFDQDEHLATD